jgi:hypothetical protein
LVYLYIPLRAFQQVAYNWGPVGTWSDVWAHISRAQYSDFDPFANQYAKTGIILSFFLEIYRQFFLPTLFLGLGGAIYLWKKHRDLAILSIGIFFLNSVAIIYLRKFGFVLGIEYTYRVYYLPAYLVLAWWVAVILGYLYDFLKQAFETKSLIGYRIIKIVFIVLILSLPLNFLIINYHNNDWSDYWLNHDWTSALLNSLEPNSIYYFAYDGSLQADTEIFSLIYFKMVEGLRPDVDIISEHNFFYKDLKLDLPDDHKVLTFEDRRKRIIDLLHEIKDRPLYLNFTLTQENNNQQMFGLPNGFAYKAISSIEEARQTKMNYYLASLRNLEEIVDTQDPANAGLASHYYYNLATIYLIEEDIHKSQEYLIKAIELDSAPFNHEYHRFIQYRKEWLASE